MDVAPEKRIQQLLKGEASLNRRFIKLSRTKQDQERQIKALRAKRGRMQFYIERQKNYIIGLKAVLKMTSMLLMNLTIEGSNPICTQNYIDGVINLLESTASGRFHPLKQET